MDTIQKKIRDLVEKKKMSTYQVAQSIGVDHANLYRSLADGSNLELNTMTKVLDCLGYEIRFVKRKTRGGNKMTFRVDNDLNLISYHPDVWEQFPDPGPQNRFQLLVKTDEYTTWKRNLESKCTSFAKIIDSRGERITHRDFCTKYGLRRGDNFEVEIVERFRVYRLIF